MNFIIPLWPTGTITPKKKGQGMEQTEDKGRNRLNVILWLTKRRFKLQKRLDQVRVFLTLLQNRWSSRRSQLRREDRDDHIIGRIKIVLGPGWSELRGYDDDRLHVSAVSLLVSRTNVSQNYAPTGVQNMWKYLNVV